MFVLFDNGTPRTLARYLIGGHSVTEARARGWQELENGDLLSQAEAAGFDVLVTTDKNLSYQQNLTGRRIAIVVLGQGRWTLIKPYVLQVVAAVNAATLGSCRSRNSTRVKLPYPVVERSLPFASGPSTVIPATTSATITTVPDSATFSIPPENAFAYAA
jgi:hypothetical protein